MLKVTLARKISLKACRGPGSSVRMLEDLGMNRPRRATNTSLDNRNMNHGRSERPNGHKRFHLMTDGPHNDCKVKLACKEEGRQLRRKASPPRWTDLTPVMRLPHPKARCRWKRRREQNN